MAAIHRGWRRDPPHFDPSRLGRVHSGLADSRRTSVLPAGVVLVTVPIPLIAGAAALAVGFAGGYGLRDLMADADAGRDAKAALTAERDARKIEAQRALDTYREGLDFGKRLAGTREIYRSVREDIPKYVTPQMDVAYPVPVGFVRQHNDAAEGRVSDSAGQSNDAPSGVALSTVSRTITDNYEVCRTEIDKLIGLQGWINKQVGQ
jgi:hypothetical protein